MDFETYLKFWIVTDSQDSPCQLDKKFTAAYHEHMKTMQIGELKTHFSEVIERVKRGEKVVVSYGKKKENVAIIIPYSEFKRTNAIKLGLLKGKAGYKFKKDYEMTEEELLNT